ncbi:glycosyltransferase family 4 protein [Rugosibacter aromaticivorans]|uniref:glycosyltransferase family 4 protein n=1 Tax=Rugosibacter aromaticivorans TaxID=1565605 RepID=UPI000ADBF39F|nr:glycosyltransferase family 1 protein [Rugosibacter aromaticivorans]TBR15334.1 MAG: glycosyltransferase family 1 protein [Rugosibacter sp.]
MPTSLHIALVTETWRPEINGVAMTLGRLTDGLRHLGHRFTLVRPRQHAADIPAAEANLREVLVAGCPIPGYRGLHFGLPAKARLLNAWREDRPDVIQVATEGPLGGSAIAAARQLNIPVVSEFHTNFHAYSRHYGCGWLEGLVTMHLRRLHNKSAVTLAPTFAVARELTAAGYRAVRVVSRGVDTALFNPQRRSMALRARWEVSEEQLVVTYIGRLAAEKNLPLVTQAFAAIRQRQPDARLLFVGDGPMRPHLERSDASYIFAGMRRGDDLAAHYASADLFLFPSLTETFGNVTLEALASGLGVLAYDCAAANELIRDGDNGRVVPGNHDDAFIAAALELARNPAMLTTLRERAQASVRHLDWGHISKQLADILHATVRSHHWQQHPDLMFRFSLD